MGIVEGLYIFDEHNITLLEHIYTSRPPAAETLLPLYLAQAAPRPALLYTPNTRPAALVFTIIQDGLLFMAPTSTDTEPLLVLEFLHRVADALEDFLGAPLLASKIEASYDVVVQVVGEMCDAGMVCNTEPNALREVVEAPTWVGSLLGGFGLPANAPTLSNRPSASGPQRPGAPFLALSNSSTPSQTSSIPWRRSNVRHTSNELYVDMVETLSVVLAPSGRPLSAIANGTIAFTAKISGVPDLLLTLSCPGGKQGMQYAMDLPCFHPCVRLARWREHPGELSFVPPDGRFILAGYECNLLPDIFTAEHTSKKIPDAQLDLPATIAIKSSLGAYGDEFEVSFTRNSAGSLPTSRNIAGTRTGRLGASSPVPRSSNNASPTAGPSLDQVVIQVPISKAVRNVSEIRVNRGEAHYLPTENMVEWRISTKEVATIGSAGATLRCTVVGQSDEPDEDDGAAIAAGGLKTDTFDYDEGADVSYQTSTSTSTVRPEPVSRNQSSEFRDVRRIRRNQAFMPGSATLSFSVRGWLASGIRVDSLTVNTKTSKGLGAGVTPYKGVKYHTISQGGIEARG